MAILKQRLNMKTSTGYNTVHLETSSDLVLRSDGTTTVESSLGTVENNISTINGSSFNAASATKLATARTFQVNLASTTTASFDGTGNVTPGVTGTLAIGNGGTGKTTAPLGLYNLINGCSTITSDSIVNTDVVAIGDVSAATAKYTTIEELKNLFGGISQTTLLDITLATSEDTTTEIDVSAVDFTAYHAIVFEFYASGSYPISTLKFNSSDTVNNYTQVGSSTTSTKSMIPGVSYAPLVAIGFPLFGSTGQIYLLSFHTSLYISNSSVSWSGLTSLCFTLSSGIKKQRVKIYGIQ